MIYCELHIKGSVDEAARRLPKSIVNAAKEAIELWHQKHLPGHFRHGAARKYGYEKRSAKYQRRKRKKGLPALVWSRATQKRLTSAAFFKVTGGTGKARGRFIVGNQFRYLWMTTKGHPKLAQEIKRTTTKEEKIIGDYIIHKMVKKMAEKSGNKRIIR